MLEIIKSYLIEQALVLFPVLWFIGAMLKITPKVQNWLIPYILFVIGAVGGGFVVGWTTQGIIQGILMAGLATLAHQLIKQGKTAYENYIQNKF